jgi:hypothetical protein
MGSGDTTRRRLFGRALGFIRDRFDEPEEKDDRPAGERRYRTYREGVEDLRRRERAAADKPSSSPELLPPHPTPRTWREGAEEVAARDRYHSSNT